MALCACSSGGSPAVTGPDLPGFNPKFVVDVLAPDDIPAITEPVFGSLGQAAEWLGPDAPVLVLRDGGSARAYPLAILELHEVVDDTIGRTPVAITYSPIANAAVAFDRRARGLTLTFGTSGKVYQSDLVMYDRETKSLWPQLLQAAAAGELKGTTLTTLPSQLASFADFAASYPNGTVLSRPGNAAYNVTPYLGYDSRITPYQGFFRGKLDGRMPAMERVVGIVDGGVARAFPYAALSARGNPAVVQEADYAVFWGGTARSPLNTSQIADGRIVGSSGVFRPRARGKTLHFVAAGRSIKDRETGSVWSLEGRALSGPLEGVELPEVHHLDAFWFAWAAFHGSTTVWPG
jgi:uncharacterized protein DUF3179